MTKKTKLELTWPGKEERPRLEPRLLIEDPAKSYHAKVRRQGDIFDNMLIKGDNLLALKALEQDYAGRVKCIYIDPPYNSDAAFGEYNDNMEHSIWLSMMRERLEILWRLLSDQNGTILISINDDEAHYLKVMCDEIFGRSKFISSFVWHYEGNTDNQAKIINYHEYVLVYSKTGDIDNPGVVDPNIGEGSKLLRGEIRNTIVKNGPKNPIKSVLLRAGFPCAFDGQITPKAGAWPRYDDVLNASEGRLTAPVTAASGWSSKDLLEKFIANDFGPVKDTKGQDTTFEITRTGAIEAVKARGSEKGHVVSVLRGFGTTNQMRIMLSQIGVKFSYPKPVDLISYLINAFTNEGDIILDSFAGSGTTAHAVMKLNLEKHGKRRFILIEMSDDTMENVLLPRLRAVIDGDPRGEIAQHGGGFRYFDLAPSLLEQDRYGNWVIAKDYNASMLAEAMCKHMGFTFAPSSDTQQYWQHGSSTETDFIYVTTQALTHDACARISHDVGPDRSLLICCKAFDADSDAFDNLTLVKIPTSILQKCEWGRDDYSLNIQNLPEADGAAKEAQAMTEGLPLFAGEAGDE